MKTYTLENSDKTKATGEVAFLNANLKHNANTQQKKLQRVLNVLINGRTFNRFESEQQLNAHCLHNTPSYLLRFGVNIFSEFETVKGWQGAPTRACRYVLIYSEENISQSTLHLNCNEHVSNGSA